MANKRKKSAGKPFSAVLGFIFFLIVAGAGAYYYFFQYEKPETDRPQANIAFADADISVHFIELGNEFPGDCTLVKVGDTEMLIDCGSETSSISTVSKYLNGYVTDGILEYVIITHAHKDHYAGFATNTSTDSIFDLYECKTIITFAKTKQAVKGLYANYLRELSDEVSNGATHYTADKCYNQEGGAKRTFDLGKGYEFEILYNKYYWDEATTENDYSVCCMVQGGGNHFLFTGDLEKAGEEALAAQYKIDHPSLAANFKVDLYKAGHHGSKTSSNEKFLEVFKPKICCVCCCAGGEYLFPKQEFIDRISVYTDKVYITTLYVDDANKKFKSFNGNIVVFANAEGIGVQCSDNNTVLKDTAWFKANRTCANWS
ncbi:MAG: MBL fold metallo-hydrolase [Clostridia bacterium]|nr:MBL fold metallo-hydrolase [Clostridia bacterium]